jgi:hypothetical protein
MNRDRAYCPLLRGPENYSSWKTKMEMVLIRERLWGIVCERRIKSESDIKVQADFDDDAERATATIFLHLDDNTERYVRDIRDPVLVWKKLQEVCQSTGYAARYNLWRKLFTLKFETEKGISGYLDKIRGIVTALREAGVTVSEEIVVSVALVGLGDLFSTLITVITHKELPSLDSLSALLLDKEARIQMKGIGSIPDDAYLARDTVCWHCQKPGHKKDTYWELHPELRPKGAQTGPLPTPGTRGKLSPPRENARAAVEYTDKYHW